MNTRPPMAWPIYTQAATEQKPCEECHRLIFGGQYETKLRDGRTVHMTCVRS